MFRPRGNSVETTPVVNEELRPGPPVGAGLLVALPRKYASTYAHCMRIIVPALHRTSVNSRDIIRTLRADGWFEVDQEGSHKQFRHPTKKGRATVPHPKRDIPIGTLRSIEKQSGLKLK